nr:Rnf145 protein [Danio rerio]
MIYIYPEAHTEEGIRAEEMKTSAEQKLGMDLLPGSLNTQPKECDLVAEGSAGTASNLKGDDYYDDDDVSTSDVNCAS